METNEIMDEVTTTPAEESGKGESYQENCTILENENINEHNVPPKRRKWLRNILIFLIVIFVIGIGYMRKMKLSDKHTGLKVIPKR